MKISVESPTFSLHGAGCPRCRSADFPRDLCRNGRRLYWAYLEGMNQDQRAIYIMGLPEDIRADVASHFKDDQFQFLDLAQTKEEGEN